MMTVPPPPPHFLLYQQPPPLWDLETDQWLTSLRSLWPSAGNHLPHGSKECIRHTSPLQKSVDNIAIPYNTYNLSPYHVFESIMAVVTHVIYLFTIL